MQHDMLLTYNWATGVKGTGEEGRGKRGQEAGEMGRGRRDGISKFIW